MFLSCSRERHKRGLGSEIAIFSCLTGKVPGGACFDFLRSFILSKVSALISGMTLCWNFCKQVMVEVSAAIMSWFLRLCFALQVQIW